MAEKEREQARVTEVLALIQEKLNGLTENKGKVTRGIVDLRKNFWEDVTVNLDEADDVYETQASIKQQAELLSERERRHGQMSRQMKLLVRLQDSPYFGRIDFREADEEAPESIYIGVGSLMNQNDEDFLIYDWRAPIASMYYDFAPGAARYLAIDGEVQGTIELKRQFIIHQGQISAMFDTGLTIGDTLLQKLLGGKASMQMKSIVATIQKEQNQIIRNQTDRFLIVQGAAGSGKTSAALQRVAFLLYRNRKTLHSENMLLFSPNPLFSSFISSVLPELGEENVVQTTFKDFIDERLGHDLQLENPFDQTEDLLTLEDMENRRIRIEGIRFKASMTYIALMESWLQHLKGEGMIFRDIRFRERVILTGREIERRFYARFQEQPIRHRLEELRDWLLKRMAIFAKKERRKDWVLEEGELLDQSDYAEVFEKLQEKKQFSEDTFDDFDREEEMLRRIVMNRRVKPIRRWIKRLGFVNYQKIYSEIFYRVQYPHALPPDWHKICQQTRMRFEEGDCPWEDAVPYLYLKEKLTGGKGIDTIRHLIIDEAQDYSPVQLTYLRTAFPRSSMTILGDHNQAIYAQSYAHETMLDEALYPQDQVHKLVLMRSYRSTKEIMEFARCLVPEGERIEAFERHGKLPELVHTTQAQRLDYLMAKLRVLRAEGMETIALVGKTMAECRELYRQLDSRTTVKLITQTTYQFDKGLIVIPTYLAKGIEFDAVIVIDASAANYTADSERTLFYTACTRAMHQLILLTEGAATNFLEGVPSACYSTIETIDRGGV
ncbi:MAG: RNA polymerase recycling motor HelD [Sporolactobacillus sp.]